jgi:hypothetical protein
MHQSPTRVPPPPPGWGADELSAFLETAYQNRYATFVNKKDWFRRLARIDGAFLRITKDWLNPTNLISPLLFFRCHAAYRAACEHALAGQIAESFLQNRACLEYAGYSLHIHKNAGFDELWLRRHDDDASLKAMKAEFLIAKISASIANVNRHTAKVFDDLYQRAIDYGAHPNERSMTGSLAIVEREGGRELQQIYLHGEGLLLDHALKTVAQTGVCGLEILQEAFAARFELLGVRAELLELRKGL